MNEKSRNSTGKLVLASGVFDLVHYGHVFFLQEAKKAGGDNSKLIVVVARDKTVEKLKGRPPVVPEQQRRAIVQAIKPVDEAILGNEELDMAKMLRDLKPDIVAVGYDQEKIEEEVNNVVTQEKLDITVARIGRFLATELDSSSKIRNKILNHQK